MKLATDTPGRPGQPGNDQSTERPGNLGHPDLTETTQQEPKPLAAWKDAEIAAAIRQLTRAINETLELMNAEDMTEAEQMKYEAQANLAFDQREALQIEQIRRHLKELEAQIESAPCGDDYGLWSGALRVREVQVNIGRPRISEAENATIVPDTPGCPKYDVCE